MTGFRAESLRLDLKGDETVESLIRPVLEHLEKLLDHGEDANLDPKPSTYLLAWLSYFVRNPGRRSKVAIILRGVQVGIPSAEPLQSFVWFFVSVASEWSFAICLGTWWNKF